MRFTVKQKVITWQTFEIAAHSPEQAVKWLTNDPECKSLVNYGVELITEGQTVLETQMHAGDDEMNRIFVWKAPEPEADDLDNEKMVYMIDIEQWDKEESPRLMFDPTTEEGNQQWKDAAETFGRIESLESFSCDFNDDSINSDRYYIRIL